MPRREWVREGCKEEGKGRREGGERVGKRGWGVENRRNRMKEFQEENLIL